MSSLSNDDLIKKEAARKYPATSVKPSRSKSQTKGETMSSPSRTLSVSEQSGDDWLNDVIESRCGDEEQQDAGDNADKVTKTGIAKERASSDYSFRETKKEKQLASICENSSSDEKLSKNSGKVDSTKVESSVRKESMEKPIKQVTKADTNNEKSPKPYHTSKGYPTKGKHGEDVSGHGDPSEGGDEWMYQVVESRCRVEQADTDNPTPAAATSSAANTPARLEAAASQATHDRSEKKRFQPPGLGGDSLHEPGAVRVYLSDGLHDESETNFDLTVRTNSDAMLTAFIDSKEKISYEATVVPESSKDLSAPVSLAMTECVEAKVFEEEKIDAAPSMRSRCIKIVGYLLLLIIFIIVISFAFGGRGNDDSSAELETPHTNTTTVGLMDLLPNYTREALQNPASPQGRAYIWMETDSQVADYSNYRKLQRFALATLFYSTSGEHWINNDGWLFADTEECKWFSRLSATGICEDGQYQVLSLDANGLHGEIPPELSLLTSLKEIQLVNNTLTGSIPVQISQLSDLHHIRLSTNELTGSIPSGLEALSHLITLDLEANELSNTIPTNLGHLSQLQVISVGSNSLSGRIPTEFSLLSNLVFVSLPSNHLSGSLEAIWNWRDVEYLDLSHNGISGSLPYEIALLSSVKALFLQGNALTGTLPSQLGELTALEQLLVSRNSLTGTVPPALAHATSLTHLGLHSSGLSSQEHHHNSFSGSIPSSICDLVELGTDGFLGGLLVDVNCTQVGCDCCNCISNDVPSSSLGFDLSVLPEYTKQSIEDLASPQSRAYYWLISDPHMETYSHDRAMQRFVLATLFFSTSNVTTWHNDDKWLDYDSHECDWFGNEVYCMDGVYMVLSLSANGLSGEIPPELGLLTSLEEIFLSNNTLIGTLPRSIGNLSKLEHLDVSENELSQRIPSEIGLLSNLIYLHLEENNFSEAIPTELGALADTLEVLDISYNSFHSSFPSEIGNLIKVWDFWADHSSITGTIPAGFSALSDIMSVGLSNNQLTGDTTFLDDWGRLMWLDVSNNQFTGRLPSFASFRLCGHFNFSNNFINGTIPTELGLLRDLTMLSLAGNNLTGTLPDVVGEMTSLHELSLSHNNLKGTLPSVLGQLEHMHNMNLAGNKFSGEIPSQLGQLPLHVLTLNEQSLGQDNQFSGKTPWEVCQQVMEHNTTIFVDCGDVGCDCGCTCV